MRTTTEIIHIGDPFVLLENGVYYMYATHSSDGISVWKGSSLNNLSYAGLCYLKNTSFGYECFWAPEVVKRADGKFVMHFTARDRADGILRTGVAVADSPEGIFCDVVPDKPMFNIGTATIDATCFTDEDGKSYLFFVKDCSTNVINGIHTSRIFAVELTADLTKFAGEPVLVAEPSQEWETHSLPAPCVSLTEEYAKKNEKVAFLWNEGPFVLKHGGKYHLTYSANCYDSKHYSVGVAAADSPLGPYKKYGNNPVMSFIEGELSGPGHNAFFTDKDGSLVCVFHSHTNYNAPSGDRRFCYCPAFFRDGKLIIQYK